MKKLFFIAVCCMLLSGCSTEKTTICINDSLKSKHVITIKHNNNKITYYKNEYTNTYETIIEAQQEFDEFFKLLKCENNTCHSLLEGENGWEYSAKIDNKKVTTIQEIKNYETSYDDEIQYIESLNNYICKKQ